MEANTVEKKMQFKQHIGRRVIALCLAGAMLGGSALAWRVQIRENELEYVGTVLEQAASVTRSNTAYLRQSTLERAKRVLRHAIRKPKKFEDFDTYASLAIASGDFEEAIAYLQSCMDTYPGDSDAERAVLWLRMGSLYTLTEKPMEAIDCYDKALELNDTLADAYLLRAQMKCESGTLESAADDLRHYEKLAGSNPVVQGALGGLYESIEDYKTANECYTLAIESGQYEVNMLASRARCRILTDDPASALNDLNRFFQEGGTDENGDYYAMLGMCRMEKEDYAGALGAFHQAIARDYSGTSSLLSQCVACAYVTEDYESVVKDGTLAIADARRNGADEEQIASLSQWVGLAHFVRGEYPEAAEALKRVIEYDPSVPNMYYYVGVSYMSCERAEEAVEYLLTSAKRGEYSSVCYYNSALCHMDMGEYQKAFNELNSAIRASDDATAVQEAIKMRDKIKFYLY